MPRLFGLVFLVIVATGATADLTQETESRPLHLRFGTYFGGSGHESNAAVAIGADGSVFLGGVASSSDLPVSRDAAQREPGPAYLAAFGAGGALEYSTYFGSTGRGGGII